MKKITDLLRKLSVHISFMDYNQKCRQQGILLIEARNAIKKLLEEKAEQNKQTEVEENQTIK